MPLIEIKFHVKLLERYKRWEVLDLQMNILSNFYGQLKTSLKQKDVRTGLFWKLIHFVPQNPYVENSGMQPPLMEVR